MSPLMYLQAYHCITCVMHGGTEKRLFNVWQWKNAVFSFVQNISHPGQHLVVAERNVFKEFPARARTCKNATAQKLLRNGQLF